MKCLTAAVYCALATLVIGCGPVEQTYTVVTHNNNSDPMTIVLTKDGGPMEGKWLPPEDLAMMHHAPPDLKVNGVVIPPGKTAEQTRTGKFDAGTNAVLRVYHGPQTFESMLGISPGSPNRSEVYLTPGLNTIIIAPDGTAARQ